MKSFTLILFVIISSIQLHSQTYTHPTIGIASEYVGACETATCTGTYTDDGGAAGDYSNDITSIYRVFCPNTAGNCVRLTFNSFDVQPLSGGGAYRDYLTIGNGPTQNSTLFTTSPADINGRIYGTPAVPFSYTSSHSSGCLTSRFTSNGNTTRPGWSATYPDGSPAGCCRR